MANEGTALTDQQVREYNLAREEGLPLPKWSAGGVVFSPGETVQYRFATKEEAAYLNDGYTAERDAEAETVKARAKLMRDAGDEAGAEAVQRAQSTAEANRAAAATVEAKG